MAWPLARCGFIPQFLPAETGTSLWLPPRALSSSLTFKTSKGVRCRRAAPVVVASIHHPCGARGVADFPLAPAVNVASLCAGASIGETVSNIFLTRCFSPCSDAIIGQNRLGRRPGGLQPGQTASRCTQHNEAPFESHATKSTRRPTLVSEKDNRLFRPTIPPPHSLVIQTCGWLCCVACSSSFLSGFSGSSPRPLRAPSKKNDYFVRPRYTRAPASPLIC